MFLIVFLGGQKGMGFGGVEGYLSLPCFQSFQSLTGHLALLSVLAHPVPLEDLVFLCILCV